MKEFVFDLQRFDDSKSSLSGLVLLNTVLTTLRLDKLVTKLQDDPIGNLKKDANPILKFIGTYLESEAKKESDSGKKIKGYANILASAISIIDSAAKISKHAKEKESATDAKEKESHALEITKESGLIVSELTNISNTIVKISSGKSSMVLSIVASSISMIANGLTALNGVTDTEKNKINASYLGFMKVLNKDLIKKLFNAAVETELNKIDLDDVANNLSILKNTTILDKVSNTLTKAGGVLDLVFAAAEGVLNGINKYKATFKKYTEDGIPENLATRDAFINAFTAVIHDTAHAYTKGLDDLVYNGAKALIWVITGKEGIKGNYVEVITEMFKAFNYTNTGSEDGDYLISYIHDTMIYGAGGDDYIGNIASNVQIFGGHDNDTIMSRLGDGDDYSTPQGNSILGGPGKDHILAHDINSSIYGGADDDRIGILGTKNKVYGGAGADAILIEDGADNNTVNGGLGDDIIGLESVKNVVIEYNEGDGNDYIIGYDESDVIKITGSYSTQTSGADVIITVGDGKITLVGASGKNININNKREVIGDTQGSGNNGIITLPSLWYENVNVIRGTSGKDNIRNTLDNVKIDLGGGNDSIDNWGDSVTIDGGEGDDTVWNDEGFSVSIDSGAGDDSISNSGWNVMINGGADNDFIRNYESSVSISGGDGDDTIENWYGSNISINGGEGDDSIINGVIYSTIVSSVTIDGGEGDDYIYNDYKGDSVTIDGGTGNDSIDNEGDSVTIYGGDGNDSIWNDGSSVTIDAGAGNDSIFNDWSSSVTIDGGDGDDYIQNGGEWDDYYWSGGGGSLKISGGDGDDTIYNYQGESVTIDGGTGNDLISLSSYYYHYAKNNLIQYKSGDGDDTVYGFNGDDTLSISGGSYSTKVSGNDVIVTVGDGSILLKDAASLSVINIDGKEIANPVWKLSGSTATYGTDNKTLITVSGVKSLKGLSLSGKTVTVSAAALSNQSKIEISGDGYTLALADDVTKPSAVLGKWTLNGTTATYKSSSMTAGYICSGRSISYTAAVGGETLVTVSGVKSLDGLSLNNKTVTVSKASIGTGTISISKGYTLALGADVPVSDSSAATWSVKSTKATLNGGISAGYTCDGSTITYTKASSGKALATVSGLKSGLKAINGSIDGITLNGNTITLSAKVLGTSSVKVSKGYTLALASDVPAPKSGSASWSVKSTKATLSAGTSAGYTCDGSTITYTKASSGKALATVSGLKSGLKATNGSIDGLTLNGNTITLSAKVLGTSSVKVSKDYTLALASDVPAPKSGSASWSVKSNKATLSAGTSAGYTCDSSTITYTKASSGKALATVSGLKSGLRATNGLIDGLTLNGNTITLSAKVLGSSNVKVSKGYTLALASDVPAPKSESATWSVKSNKATLSAGTSAGYTCDGSTITYTKASSGKALATVSGLKSGLKATNGSIDGLTLNGNTITLSAKVLGTSSVKVSKGYTLALASDVPAPKSGSATWSVKSNKATLSAGTSAGYTCDGSTITYTKASSGKALATVSGLKSGLKATNGKINGITLDDNTIKLSAKAISNKVSVSGGGYEFDFAEDCNKVSITDSKDNDSIKIFGSSNTVTGGKGNDTITSSGDKNLFIYSSGDGDDVIADFTSNDKIKIAKGKPKVLTSGNDVIVAVDKGSITLADAAGQVITLLDSKNKASTYLTSTSQSLKNSIFDTSAQLDELISFSYDDCSLGTLDSKENLNSLSPEFVLTYNDKK